MDAKVDKLPPYTEAMIVEMRDTYTANPTRETIEALAAKFERNVRSIVAKLSREGVYIKAPYRTKQGEIPHTKEDLVEIIAKIMEEPSDMLDGLEKAPKLVLRKIIMALDPTALDELKG